ncbi:MAG: glycosyltransferase [Spirochaetales bacterium]|nr:glycosyltransferase [Spirochaetales bacterium]
MRVSTGLSNNIAILGWSDLSKGASLGGGYNLIAQQHALYLKNRGNNVYYLKSGRDFSLAGAFTQKTKQKIRFHKEWEGIECYSLINPHNWAPADRNSANREYQISDEKQDGLVVNWLKKYQIDQVIIHSLEGQSFSLIPRLKEESISTLVFCHDYYFTCPRVSFLFEGKTPCLDCERGERCDSCMSEDFRFPLKQYLKSRFPLLAKKSGPLNTLATTSRTQLNVSNSTLLESVKKGWGDSSWGMRNSQAISALNQADRVLSPSCFLGEILLAGGLEKNKLELARIGLNHLDDLKKRPFIEGPQDGRIHFAFHGGSLYHKGVSLLLDAISLLKEETRAKACFHLWGVSLSNEEKNIICYPPYKTDELSSHASLYHVGILAHLWFENSPVAMLEHLAMGKAVITPRLGGVEDYIIDGKNGWFFEPGKGESLAQVLERIINDKEIPQVERSIVNNSENFFHSLEFIDS